MKKKITYVIVLLLIIVLSIFVFNSTSKSLFEQSKEIVKDNEIDFEKAIDTIEGYDRGDSFFIATNNDIKMRMKYKDGSLMENGDVYVWHNYGEEEIELEKIEEDSIKSILKQKKIMQIDKNKDTIRFRGDYSLHKHPEGFWGIYYSLDSKPHADSWFDDVNFRRDGNGWSAVINDGQSCYIEQIKGDFYFCEGIEFP